MRPKPILIICAVALFLIPSYASASTVFEVTDEIRWIGFYRYAFDADVELYTYQVTLSDLSVAPDEGFRFLYLALTSSGQLIGSSLGPGSFQFEADPGETYYASVFGIGGGTTWTGVFGLKVATVPIPNTLLLLGSGVLGLIFFRRKWI